MLRTIVYVDGFNFYYGSLKDTPHKWLDIEKLCKKLLKPHNQITKIKYFTARVSNTPRDPSKAERQDVYLRALTTFPTVEVYEGHFLTHVVDMPLVTPTAGQRFAQVYKTEEKGSDVNLATHLLNDAWLSAYDCAIVLSNDSDLAEAMRLVKCHHPNKVMGLFTPTRMFTSRQLKQHADFVRPIRNHLLAASLLPDTISGTNIRKPTDW